MLHLPEPRRAGSNDSRKSFVQQGMVVNNQNANSLRTHNSAPKVSDKPRICNKVRFVRTWRITSSNSSRDILFKRQARTPNLKRPLNLSVAGKGRQNDETGPQKIFDRIAIMRRCRSCREATDP